ncbi:MAG: hypothetical protein M3315_05685 [Actinomycetota bacterium]|nr:hypothetical protein [Actinomycetota bacterium]
MVGVKTSEFAPLLPDLFLEALVLKDSFYPHLPEATPDLLFVRDFLVRDC